MQYHRYLHSTLSFSAIIYVVICTSLISGAILTWIGANSPDISDIVGLRGLCWATCFIATFETVLYHAPTVAKHLNLLALFSRTIGEAGKMTQGLMFLDFVMYAT